MKIQGEGTTCWTAGAPLRSSSPVSSSTGADATVSESGLKKASGEIWWDKDPFFFRIY